MIIANSSRHQQGYPFIEGLDCFIFVWYIYLTDVSLETIEHLILFAMITCEWLCFDVKFIDHTFDFFGVGRLDLYSRDLSFNKFSRDGFHKMSNLLTQTTQSLDQFNIRFVDNISDINIAAAFQYCDDRVFEVSL